MLCGLINKKDFAVNAFLIALLFGVMWVSCRDEVFYSILFVDFVLFFFFIAIQDGLRNNQDKINFILQEKTDRKSRFILKTVNRIVEFKILIRDELYFSRVMELQNNNTELTQENSHLLVENKNAKQSIIEKNAVIQHISSEKISSISRIEHSIYGVHATCISGFRAFFSDINNYKERELKEKNVELEYKIDEAQRKYNNISKKLKKAEVDLGYIIQKGIIFEKALCRILHDFEGKDRVSKVYIATLIQVLCREASIAYSVSLFNDIYELLPPHLVLNTKGGKPSKPVIDATKELEKQLKN